MTNTEETHDQEAVFAVFFKRASASSFFLGSLDPASVRLVSRSSRTPQTQWLQDAWFVEVNFQPGLSTPAKVESMERGSSAGPWKPGTTANGRSGSGTVSSIEVAARDQDSGKRISDALKRVIALCGGKVDPF